VGLQYGKIMFGIGNFYGGLEVKEEDGKYYWGIENWDGTEFEEIPKYLYDALIKYRDTLQ
jgi:hypothetical protein